MGNWLRRQGPAFAIACLALTVALGGSVYAASRIDGRSVKPGSLPGNRVAKSSLPGNRVKPGSLGPGRLRPGSLTGRQIDQTTLGKVPEAARADAAGTARSANTALRAGAADEADRLDGHVAACASDQRLFAGTCWELGLTAPATAPAAAAACGRRGAELPAALTLTAFAALPGTAVAEGGEWSGDVALISGEDRYSVLTVNGKGSVSYTPSGLSLPYRCVTPLLR